MTRSSLVLSLMLASLVFVGTGCSTSTPGPRASGAPPVASRAAGRTSPPPVGNVAEYDHLQAVIETERGNIFLRFYPHEAPQTVANFVTLARDGFYDNLSFHRLEPGFVIQGGDPQGTGEGGPGYTLPAEFNKHKHVPGAVAMARTQDPNSAGSQFYICLGTAPHLDNQYTVFAYVEKGMENVQKLQKGDHMLKIRIESLNGGGSPSPAAAVSPSPAAKMSPGPAAASKAP